MKFDENGQLIKKVSKEASRKIISNTRAEIIIGNYFCKACHGGLEKTENPEFVKCSGCGRTTSVWSLKEAEN